MAGGIYWHKLRVIVDMKEALTICVANFALINIACVSRLTLDLGTGFRPSNLYGTCFVITITLGMHLFTG